MTKKNYWVYPNDDEWKVKPEGADRASRIFNTQKEAEDYARNVLHNNSGGELITQNQQGQIRSKDTINSHDPFPPRDNEH